MKEETTFISLLGLGPHLMMLHLVICLVIPQLNVHGLHRKIVFLKSRLSHFRE
jgi:hypothetical protein